MTPIIIAAVLLIALTIGGYLGYAFGKYNVNYPQVLEELQLENEKLFNALKISEMNVEYLRSKVQAEELLRNTKGRKEGAKAQEEPGQKPKE